MQPAFLCLLTSKIFHDLQPAKRYGCNSRKQQLQLEFSRDGKLAAVAPLNQEVGTIPYTTEEDNTILTPAPTIASGRCTKMDINKLDGGPSKPKELSLF